VAFYLGIDGGGSKTTCQVGDDHSVLATVTGGASNITRVGEARARESLHQAIRDACAAAKIDAQDLHRACIGAAGAGRADVAVLVQKIAAEILPCEIEVVGDMQIALQAAFGAGPGVIVIAGTGSMAYGRDAEGNTARAGGWGFAVSDEGSAHWIGRAAVTSVLRALDEETSLPHKNNSEHDSPLPSQLKSAWKVNTLAEFVNKSNSTSEFAALLPTILSAAAGGDHLAQGVLTQAGRELARLAALVVGKLFSESSATEVPLAMVGGVFRYSAQVRDVFKAELARSHAHVKVNSEVIEPVSGALQMARTGATTNHLPPPTSTIAPVV
jgi:N-acetylglucosamine kinase-like BadF-type ATPase